jgi:hypothetical protein
MATRVLEMSFITALNKKQTIRVPNVKDPYTGAEASTLMDKIITRDIFNPSGGGLTGKSSAQIVITDTTDLALI